MSKIKGKWRAIAPYSQREVIDFPRYGKGGVYWFNTVEALTVADTFPQLETIVTKIWIGARLLQSAHLADGARTQAATKKSKGNRGPFSHQLPDDRSHRSTNRRRYRHADID